MEDISIYQGHAKLYLVFLRIEITNINDYYNYVYVIPIKWYKVLLGLLARERWFLLYQRQTTIVSPVAGPGTCQVT